MEWREEGKWLGKNRTTPGQDMTLTHDFGDEGIFPSWLPNSVWEPASGKLRGCEKIVSCASRSLGLAPARCWAPCLLTPPADLLRALACFRRPRRAVSAPPASYGPGRTTTTPPGPSPGRAPAADTDCSPAPAR